MQSLTIIGAYVALLSAAPNIDPAQSEPRWESLARVARSVDIEELAATVEHYLLLQLCDGIWKPMRGSSGSVAESTGKRAHAAAERMHVIGDRLLRLVDDKLVIELKAIKKRLVSEIREIKAKKAHTVADDLGSNDLGSKQRDDWPSATERWSIYEKLVMIRRLGHTLTALGHVCAPDDPTTGAKASDILNIAATERADFFFDQDARARIAGSEEARSILDADADRRFPISTRLMRLIKVPRFLIERNRCAPLAVRDEKEPPDDSRLTHDAASVIYNEARGGEEEAAMSYWYAEAQCWQASGRLVSIHETVPVDLWRVALDDVSDPSTELQRAVLQVHNQFMVASRAGGQVNVETVPYFGIHGLDLDFNVNETLDKEERELAWRQFDQVFPIDAYKQVYNQIQEFVARANHYARTQKRADAIASTEVYQASRRQWGGRVMFYFPMELMSDPEKSPATRDLDVERKLNASRDRLQVQTYNEIRVAIKNREQPIPGLEDVMPAPDDPILKKPPAEVKGILLGRINKHYREKYEAEWRENQVQWAKERETEFLNTLKASKIDLTEFLRTVVP